MSDLSHLLTVDGIDAALAAANKKALFQQIAVTASRQTGIPARDIVAAISAVSPGCLTGC